jgi:hypothetical protein
MQPRSLKRTLALGLAACAIAPATASAAPAIEGQAVGAGGGPGLTARDVTPAQNLTAPDQVDRVASTKSNPGPPAWPANPRAVGVVQPATATQPSDDGGVDTGVWIALGTAAFAVAGGIGLAGSKRLRTGRQRQLA